MCSTIGACCHPHWKVAYEILQVIFQAELKLAAVGGADKFLAGVCAHGQPANSLCTLACSSVGTGGYKLAVPQAGTAMNTDDVCLLHCLVANSVVFMCRPLLSKDSSEDDVGFSNRLTVEAGVTVLPVNFPPHLF